MSTPWHEFISNTELSSHLLQLHFRMPKGISALTLVTAYKNSQAVDNLIIFIIPTQYFIISIWFYFIWRVYEIIYIWIEAG